MIEATRALDWRLSPLEALRRWPADLPVMLLHSGRYHPRWARQSILAAPVAHYRYLETGHREGVSQYSGPAAPFPDLAFDHHPFHDLRRVLDIQRGLWIGHLSYDLGRWVERLPEHAANQRHWPIVELAWCPGYLIHDGGSNTWRAAGDWAGSVQSGPPDLPSLPEGRGAYRAANLRSIFTRPSYELAVQRCLDYIGAGDIFQVNLTQRFTADLQAPAAIDRRALYERLAAVSPAWYGAYLELPACESSAVPRGLHLGPRTIASTSPELFLEVDDAGAVMTRPIKGTRPASADPRELRESPKDAAELAMIVDLLRNDLGRVCAYGSVKVPEPRIIESHPTVHHGVASVTGRLHAAKDLVDLLRATMPGGSITGAPKVRAMEIIEELEPVRRGPYCGCIGMFGPAGTCTLNIAIRTMLLDPRAELVDFSVGGGVVADSRPAGEYEETLDKAQAILRTLGLPRPH